MDVDQNRDAGARRDEPSRIQETIHASLAGLSLGIGPDVRRFRDIVRGRVREDLTDLITSDDIIAQHGQDKISVPIHTVPIPRFVRASNGESVEEGDGAGDKPAAHTRDEQFHIEELAQLLGEELGLPRIKPRLTSGLEQAVPRYDGIARRGPVSLRDNKRTYLEALKRSIAEGTFSAENPVIVPIKDDFRFRSPRLKPRPKTNAVIFYIIDVSGSMGELQKSVARNTAFWTDAWIDQQYKGAEKCYIIHDAAARVVDRETFFTTHESGGTLISSAYEVLKEEMATRFYPDQWNTYVFHFSDGDNFSTSDNKRSLDLLTTNILPFVNLYGYVEIGARNKLHAFKRFLEEQLPDVEQVVLTSMDNRSDIIPGIKELLGTGR